MKKSQQLPLLPNSVNQLTPTENASVYSGRDIGTFKDSMRAPIHRWFRYPAGYSYKFVFESFDLFDVGQEDWVYDPFSGSGTTLLSAKQRGINAYGVEAHSFVHWVANVKLNWDFELDVLRNAVSGIIVNCRKLVEDDFENTDLAGIFPELVYKCYHLQDLKVLYLLREFITHNVADEGLQDILKLALTDTLRGAAAAGTGWPYVSPRKNTGEKPPKNALAVFETTINDMILDLKKIDYTDSESQICNVLGDSRLRQDLANEQAKLALTSPPYLNNYDYADRTRLETYFWGIADSWSDITEKFRDKLMIAATTQIVRRDFDVTSTLDFNIADVSRPVYKTIQESVLKLADLRLQKGGKKDYDLMVALYFNDIFQVLRETYRVLQNGGHFCLVLGDSAPYGVHVKTDELVGKLGVGIGFKNFSYHELRKRGGKWKDNPQRHKVPLREGIVILEK